MRQTGIAALVLVVLLALAGGSSRQPAAAAANDMVSVIVTLEDQATLAGLGGQTRRARLERVVRALRAKADRTQAALARALEHARRQGAVQEYRPFWILNGFEVTATRAFVAGLERRSDVLKVTPNATIAAPAPEAATTSTPETNVALIGAPDLWSLGHTGGGIVVASMDTGVDATHPDLSAQWRGGANSWFDPNGQHPNAPIDLSGHGTRTMGVMVGRAAGGTAIGVAPDAQWIAVKIFNDAGSATVAGIHAGFQWLLDPDGDPATADAPHVVNNSWTFAGSGCNLEFQLDLQALRAANVIPVFAAGNYGPLGSTSRSPANNPEALAVGATTKSDGIWTYSSRGPTSCADADATYPELVAPGAAIRTTDRFGGYATASGTSLAAPHVSGALALLLDGNAGATAGQLEAALESTGVDLGVAGPDAAYGYGRLNATAAHGWLGAPPADFALAASPSTASTTQGGGVGYTVSVAPQGGFAGDVALTVSGLPAEASGSFEPPAVPGGSGSSLLAVSTTPSTPPGTYPLTITGASGSLAHTAAVSLTVTAPTETVYPAAATIVTGTLRSGGPADLAADDTRSYEVNSSNRVTAWYGSFSGVPNAAPSLSISYKGGNSRTCSQTVSVWRWTTGSWVQLASGTVGATQVLYADRTPPGAPADYVSDGAVRVRVRCTVTSGSFVASGNLLELVYLRP